jgi:hypothetical protein
MQGMDNDWHEVIVTENNYLESWSKEIMLKMFNEKCYVMLQDMDSSRNDNLMEIQVVGNYNELLYDFVLVWQEVSGQWEKVFCDDNLIIFDDDSWKSFLKTKPTIDWGEGWTKIVSKKKYRGFNHNRKFKLNISGWYHLKKITNKISFVHSIDVERNNMEYIRLMNIFGFDGKIIKYENFLDKVRKREFIRMEADRQCRQSSQLHHQLNHPQYLQRNLQQYREWQLRTRKPPQELKKVPENIHITYQKLKEPSPWLLRSLNINNMRERKKLQPVVNTLTRLGDGLESANKDRLI